MEIFLFVLGILSLLVWGYLILFRGLFWQADQELDPDQVEPREWPGVVALIPARNEADVIDETLETVLTQDYDGPYQVILINDHSSDGTTSAARRVAQATPAGDRLTIIAASDLPRGWSGKVWALAQGYEEARRLAPDARYLWLADADITHWLHNLRGFVAKAEGEKLDMVSLIALLNCEDPWEQLLIPPFVFFFQKLFPFRWVNNPKRPMAAAAGGSLLVNIEALEAAGGFQAIKDEIIDDCALAARVKPVARQRGRGIWLGLGEEAVSIRPYDGLMPIWRMVARSAYAYLQCSPKRLAAAVPAMLLTYLGPPLAALGGVFAGLFLDIQDFGTAFLGLLFGAVAWGLMAVAAWPTLRLYGQPVWMGLLLPAAAFFYTGMLLDSAWRHRNGRGAEWKERVQTATGSLED